MVGAISMLGGVLLVFRLGTPAALGRLHTLEIIGMLGLLFLPLVMLWAFWADVHRQRAQATREQQELMRQSREDPYELEPRSECSGLFAGQVSNQGTGLHTGIDPDEHGLRPVRVWGEVHRHVSPTDRPGEDAGRERHHHRLKRQAPQGEHFTDRQAENA